jgi:hypothetical protein
MSPTQIRPSLRPIALVVNQVANPERSCDTPARTPESFVGCLWEAEPTAETGTQRTLAKVWGGVKGDIGIPMSVAEGPPAALTGNWFHATSGL